MSSLTEEQEDEFREAFRVHDKGSGSLTSRDLGFVMRYLGHNPTLSELEDMCRQFGSGGGMTQDGFLRMMGAKYKEGVSEGEIMDAFRVFDKDGKGFLSMSELRYIMSALGDRIDESEVEQLLNEAFGSDAGSVNYTELVRQALTR
eukprot:TRINITY_DN132_c2_g7_i1.p1 TRINITY_DN132_c2_g7~~TRINITY_DN132_c2_g7_i1.p1  ORF type:complete len:146 (-),score=81.82 TRINITY_DN132_c2_g7_i1:117-554(-)